MFSGIIQAQGQIQLLRKIGKSGLRVLIKCDIKKFPKLTIGESIAVDGVCLTVIKFSKDGFEFEVSPETIAICKGNLFSENNTVNLERAMRYGDVVGGHLVSGHVDAVGEVAKIINGNEFCEMCFKTPKTFTKYLVNKGCVAVNGVSLTVNLVKGNSFTVMLIPHTLTETNLGELKVGSKINLESDLLARYVLNYKK